MIKNHARSRPLPPKAVLGPAFTLGRSFSKNRNIPFRPTKQCRPSPFHFRLHFFIFAKAIAWALSPAANVRKLSSSEGLLNCPPSPPA